MFTKNLHKIEYIYTIPLSKKLELFDKPRTLGILATFCCFEKGQAYSVGKNKHLFLISKRSLSIVSIRVNLKFPKK